MLANTQSQSSKGRTMVIPFFCIRILHSLGFIKSPVLLKREGVLSHQADRVLAWLYSPVSILKGWLVRETPNMSQL